MMTSPSKQSHVSLAHNAGEERTGFFSVVDSSAPRMPSARRFAGGYEASPGPGQYETQGTLSGAGSTTIPRAGRFIREREGVFGTPGPASYSYEQKDAKGIKFGKSVRGRLTNGEVATGSHVGPGSYNSEVVLTSTSPRRTSGGTFGKARRSPGGVGESTPGPGFYSSSVTPQFSSKPKGGTFGRAPRSGVFNPDLATPGIGAYNSNSSTFGTPRGGTMSRTGRTSSRFDNSPGPGSYNPLHAASSGSIKLR